MTSQSRSNFDGDSSEPEIDEETRKVWDAVELEYSPTKTTRFSRSISSFTVEACLSDSNNIRRLATAGLKYTASWPPSELKTPSKKRDAEPHTSAGRASAVRRAFDSIRLASPSKSNTLKKPFPGASISPSKNKMNRTVILVGESDVEDTMEIEPYLTDTESEISITHSPRAHQNSVSSIGSDWDRVESFSSFSLKSPSAGSSSSSPSKYRKLSKVKELPPSNKGTSSSTTSKPKVVKDVFNPSASPSSSPQRNNGWDISITQPSTLAPTPLDDDVSFNKFLAGTDLEPHIIAHDKNVVSCMDRHKLPWGVQYEIARGVTEGIWSWASVEAKIPQLCGSNSEKAHQVRNIMLDKIQPLSASGQSVWKELDREQDAIMENKGCGLGPVGLEGSENTWYGGKIQQTAKLVGDKGNYRIRLEPMENKRSYRLARFLGSRRIIQCKIPKDLIFEENRQLKEFMQRKFVLCGRIFVPFFAKDHAVYLVETADDYERRAAEWAGDQFRMSFKDIINRQNPLHLNADQPINKYATRFALAFSTSVPVLEFEEKNITIIPDETDTWRKPGKPPAEYIKTDGCGFINEAALKIIGRFLNYHGYPVAVQGRVYGAKGLWILHHEDRSPEPKIWIRYSQQKIRYAAPVPRCHLIFDLLSASSSESSVSLSKQSIMNLSNNGVSDTTLIDIMKKALIEEVRPLMKWQGSQAMEILWNFIDRMSSVSRTRFARVAASMSRALGLAGQAWRGEEIDIERNEDTPLESEGTTDIYIGRASSGAPLTLSEYVMELLQAGFHAKDSTIVKEKIRYLVEKTIESIVDKFSIPLPESLNAFIVPDPLGVLKEGEVYYRSSVPIANPETQDVFNVLTGKVLLGRYPVRLASDIQKVTAVDRPELSRWVDVLIVSTQGEKSFASMLSGGDYDGDKVFILYSNSLLEDFKNKPVTPIPPHFMDDNFQKHPERVKQFADRVSALAPREAQKAFADVLMFDIDDKKFGLYSTWQDYAIYEYGYEDPLSERLAYIFNALLDSSKTGDRLKPGIFERDQKQFGKSIPDFQQSRARKPYIFHTLHRAGKIAGDELLREYDELKGETHDLKDNVLLGPYNNAANRVIQLYDESKKPGRSTLAVERYSMLAGEIKRIKECVDVAHLAYKRAIELRRAESSSPTKKPRGKKSLGQRKSDPITHVYELYDRQVEDVFFFQNVDEIKASFAYQLEPRFGFDVAFRELCTMKAKASPHGIAPTTRSFDEAKAISSTYVKVVTRHSASNA